MIRPQRLKLSEKGAASQPNALAGKVISAAYLGGNASYEVEAGGVVLRANNPLTGQLWQEGAEVSVSVDPQGCVLLDATSGNRLR